MTHIRNYFGEECGLYFSWTDHFRRWLIAPAIIGLLCSFLAAIFGGSPWAEDVLREMEEALNNQLDETYKTDATVQMINLIFAMILIVWSVLF